MNKRVLLDGSTVDDYDKPIDLIIHTKAPGKWKVIDMETGEEYIGSKFGFGSFGETLREKVKSGIIGSWHKIKESQERN